MTLHIFNPEHDIALASGLSNFTAPHAGRQLRHDLGFLPAIWAREGDVIMVDDPEQAERLWQKLTHRIKTLLGDSLLAGVNREFAPTKSGVCCVPLAASEQRPSDSNQHLEIDPWGWNSALRAKLIRLGLSELQLPTLLQLESIRNLSHRHTAAVLLPKLRTEGTIGEMFECQTSEQVEELLTRYGQLVLKAPWSSSGRGLRFLSIERTPFSQQAGWFRNIVQAQGCVMVEPYYNKVKDFGMEFQSDGQGHVEYLGLSLFHTVNGAYTGNILATETAKRAMIGRYLPLTLLDEVQAVICRELGEVFCEGRYRGPFGVDMMVCDASRNGETSMEKRFLLHPCVEVNLRRTMGHVALALSPKDDDLRRVMRIEYSGNNYKLLINRL